MLLPPASDLPPCPADGHILSTALQMLVLGIRGLASLLASGKESQRGALAYRKTCGYCHVEVGLWAVGGPCTARSTALWPRLCTELVSHRAGLVERQQVGRAGETEAKTIENLAFPAGEPGVWGGFAQSLSVLSCHSHQVFLACLQPQPPVPRLLFVSDPPSHRDICGWVKAHHDSVDHYSSPVFLLYCVVRIQAHIQAQEWLVGLFLFIYFSFMCTFM